MIILFNIINYYKKQLKSVIAVRVTKPRIPKNVQRNYEDLEEERTKLLIAVEKQKTLERQAETSKLQQVIRAETEAEISIINKKKEIAEQESISKISTIKNQMNFDKIKSDADSYYYREIKEIDANEKRLTDQYLRLKWLESLGNNTKLYFGESIPKYLGSNNLGIMENEIKNK